MTTSPNVDVLIIGGGPAGLSCALALSRALHTAVLFDSNTYRNQLSNHMHIVPSWDHQDPSAFRAAARRDITTNYNTVKIEDVAVEKLEKLDSGFFKATDAKGREWTGRKVVLAMGSKDIYPDIQGYRDCWVKGIFHCLFCHGYEEAGTHSVGVLAVDDCAAAPFASHLSLQARQFTKSITCFTNGNTTLAAELVAALGPKGIKIESRAIKKLVKETKAAEVTVHFEDGESETMGFLVHKPKTELHSKTLAEQLGLELTPGGDLKVGPMVQECTVPGVYAAGDCATGMKMVTGALASGVAVAAGITMAIQKET